MCEDNGRNVEIIESESCVKVDDINMGIMTWAQVIENLLNTAEASAEHLLADIKQLKGYCEQIDSEAFIPFKPEELTAINAKKAERYYLIIDKVTELILTDKSLKYTKNNTKAGNRDGYISYIYVNDYAIGICYDRYFWGCEGSVETPFWLSVKKDMGEKWWKQTEDIVKQFTKIQDDLKIEYNSVVYLALRVLTHATEDEVCKSIKNQILNYIDEIDKGINGTG